MKKLRDSAKEILNLYNYFNGAIIFDSDAIAVWYYNNRPDINHMTEENVVGKHLHEIYPDLDLRDSTIMEALNEGIPTSNKSQQITSFLGETINEINTTIPIFEDEKIVGAVEVTNYMFSDGYYGNIFITGAIMDKRRNLYTTDDIITSNVTMIEIKKRIRKVSLTDSSVIICGETGTGKEMVAESIHTGSKRSNKKFVVQNCSAIPSTLLESILFGTSKGSYTDARDRIGILENASQGTLFLDEINSMDLNLQAKILKAIEEQKITRLGEFDARPIDIRIIAATNEEPGELIRCGRLRADLYYRLRVVRIDLPSLNERKEDILNLTRQFIRRFNKIMDKNIIGIDKQVENRFMRYDWPGNIRELRNLIERGFNFADDEFIRCTDIFGDDMTETISEQLPLLDMENGIGLRKLMCEYERCYIEKTIQEYGNMNTVAHKLGITRQNLEHKLKRYGLKQKK